MTTAVIAAPEAPQHTDRMSEPIELTVRYEMQVPRGEGEDLLRRRASGELDAQAFADELVLRAHGINIVWAEALDSPLFLEMDLHNALDEERSDV